MDEGTGLTPEAVKELRRATDLALRATKHTARAVGRSMAGSVAAECHLWLNLTEIHEKEKVFLLDALISQSGLFGEVVSSVVEKFRSTKTQSAALKQFMPRRTRDHSTPSSSLSREQSERRKERSLLAGVVPRLRILPRLRSVEPVAGLSLANDHADGLTWSGPADPLLRLLRVIPDPRVGMRRAASPLRGETRPQKRICPPQTRSPHSDLSHPPLKVWCCRKSPSSFFFGLAVGGRVGLSPSTVCPFAASGPRVRRHSPALHSPSSQTRTPRAFLRGGGRHFFQAFSTPNSGMSSFARHSASSIAFHSRMGLTNTRSFPSAWP